MTLESTPSVKTSRRLAPEDTAAGPMMDNPPRGCQLLACAALSRKIWFAAGKAVAPVRPWATRPTEVRPRIARHGGVAPGVPLTVGVHQPRRVGHVPAARAPVHFARALAARDAEGAALRGQEDERALRAPVVHVDEARNEGGLEGRGAVLPPLKTATTTGSAVGGASQCGRVNVRLIAEQPSSLPVDVVAGREVLVGDIGGVEALEAELVCSYPSTPRS